MSRSRKKNPFVGNIKSVSEKKNKQTASRILRRKIKRLTNFNFLKFTSDSEQDIDLTFPDQKEISDPTMFCKHGKSISEEEKDFRK